MRETNMSENRNYPPAICATLTKHPKFRYQPGMPLNFHGYVHLLESVSNAGSPAKVRLWWHAGVDADSDDEAPWMRDEDGWAQEFAAEFVNHSGDVWPVLDIRHPAAWGFLSRALRKANTWALPSQISSAADATAAAKELLRLWGPAPAPKPVNRDDV